MVEHPRDGEKHSTVSRFFRALLLPAWFRTEQTHEASLFVKYLTRARGIIVEYTQHKNKTSRKIPIEEQFIFLIIVIFNFGLMW